MLALASPPVSVRRQAVPVVLVLAALGASAIAGYGRLPGGSAGVLVGLGVATLVGLGAWRLQSGLLVLPALAALVPFGIGTGTQSTVVLSLAFAISLIGAWALRMLATGKLVVVRSPVVLPLAGFLLVTAISSANADVMLDPLVQAWPGFGNARLGGLAVFWASGLTLLMAASLLRPGWLRPLVWIYVGIGAALIGWYLVTRGRTEVPGAETGGMLSLWLVSLAWGQALFNTRLSWPARAGLVLLALAWSWRRFFAENDWVSGWLPILLSLGVITLLRSRRLAIALLLVGLLFVAVDFDQIDRFYLNQTAGSEAEGNSDRLQVWSQNLEVTQHHLLLGTGVAGYAIYYMTFNPNTARSSHSNYLDIFAQTGILGSMLFLWLWFALFRVAVSAARRRREGFEGGYGSACVGALVGLTVAMALGDWLIPFVYNGTIAGFRSSVHSWILLGGLAALQSRPQGDVA